MSTYIRYPAAGSGGGITAYANFASLPASAPDATVAVTQDTDTLYVFNAGSSTWKPVGSPSAILNIGSIDTGTPSDDGAHISGNSLILQSASASKPGLINTGAQSIAGVKTFGSQVNADAGLQRSTSGTLSIGTALTASTINIGNSGCTVNIQGTVLYENVTQLQVADPLITLNKGGAAGSAANSGIELEENSVITGYWETSADRNSWIGKAPATAGIVTLTPGAGGITLNQSSHNPVTIGTANGLSLSTQVLSLALSSTSTTGALSSTDWNTFNNKQSTLTLGNLTEATSSILTISGGTGAIIGSGLTIQVKQAATGQSGYLSNTDWNTFNNKQAALTIGNLTEATSSVLTITGGTGAIIGSSLTIQVKQAATGQAGYLSSTDWNTFNNKQAALSFGNLTAPSFLSVTGGTGAVIGSGASLTLATQTANTLFAGPATGAAAAPTFRAMVAADLGSAVVPVGNGGSGQTSANAALNVFLPTQTSNSGKFLKTDGSNTSWDTPVASISYTWVSSSYGSGGTRVTGTPPTALGEYRSYLRNASANTFTETNGAPGTAPSSTSGFFVYRSTGWAAANTSNQPTKYEIFVGANKRVDVQFWGASSKSGIIDVMARAKGTQYDGYAVLPRSGITGSDGIVTIVAPASSSLTATPDTGLDANGATVTTGFFDIAVYN